MHPHLSVTRALFLTVLLLISIYLSAARGGLGQGIRNAVAGSGAGGGRHTAAESAHSTMVGEGRQQGDEAAAANGPEVENAEESARTGSYDEAHNAVHSSVYEEVRVAANRRQLMEMQDHPSAEEI